MRTSYVGQQRTCRQCNQPGHQARECKFKICFNCDHVGHEAPDCENDILCSICKGPTHLAKYCPYGWNSPKDRDVPVEERPEVPPMSEPVESDLQPSQELSSQPPSPQDLPLQSSQSSPPPSASGSPSFSPVPEISQESSSSADDSNDDDPVEMDSLPPPNAVTASDEEMTHVISDPDLLNSSAQCTDVELDPDLFNTKRPAEESNCELDKVNHKKKRYDGF